jgi:hypothetical protein
MRNCRAERFIPRRVAAPAGPERTHLVSFSVAKICARSASSRVWCFPLACPGVVQRSKSPSGTCNTGPGDQGTESPRAQGDSPVRGCFPATGIGSRRSSFAKGSSRYCGSCAGRNVERNGAPTMGCPPLARAAQEREVEIHSNDRIDRSETSAPPAWQTDRDWWRRSDVHPFALSVCSPIAQTRALAAPVEAWFEDRAGPRQFHPRNTMRSGQRERAERPNPMLLN